ncbi:ATPase, AFG1 family domain protein [Pseudarthrobacter siccitolerans]|uniref:ATPase, AFG1 family domain protein n=1 Tax=Pseudarthrobacter siccitolerans TaxID=861266 RepID=A0A024H3J0_9MICC|nr:ATPase, AFG1 family domain protein [Pseudarthrobacter siccitolerans]
MLGPAPTVASAPSDVRIPLTGGNVGFITHPPSVAGATGSRGALPVSFLGTNHQQNGPPWYRSNSLPPAPRRYRWMSSSRVSILRRGSAKCPSQATGPIPGSPARHTPCAPCRVLPRA